MNGQDPLAFFKAGSPNLDKLKPILFNEKKESTKNITKDLSKEITKLLEKPINVNEAKEGNNESKAKEEGATKHQVGRVAQVHHGQSGQSRGASLAGGAIHSSALCGPRQSDSHHFQEAPQLLC